MSLALPRRCFGVAVVLAISLASACWADEGTPAGGADATTAVPEAPAPGSDSRKKPAPGGEAKASVVPSAPTGGADTAKTEPTDDAPTDLGQLSPANGGSTPATDATMTPLTQGKAQYGTVAGLEGGSGVRVQSICTNCNQANLTVNGVTGDAHVPVTFDGAPSPGGLGTVYMLNQFPAELVGYSHVIRGPGTVQSGSGGMGGLLEFHSTARTTQRKSYLRSELGAWGTRALKVAGAERWGKLGALVFVQGGRQDAVDANGDGANEMGKFDRLTTHGIFDVHLTEKQVLTFNGLFYGETQVAGPGKPVRRENRFDGEDVNLNWHQYGLSYEWDGGDGSSVRMDVASSRRWQSQFNILRVPRERIPYLTVEDTRHFAHLEGRVPLGHTGIVTSAIGYQRTEANVFNDGAVEQRYVDDGLRHWELTTQYDRSLGSKWDMSAGMRYDKFSVFGRTKTWDYATWKTDPDQDHDYLLPRAQVRWHPNEKILVSLSTGRFAVGPTPVFEKTCCGAQFARSLDIVPERSWSHQAQVELHPTRDMRITVTAFQTDFTDYILRLPKRSSFGIPEYTNINVAHARVRGLDLVHDIRLKDDMFNVGWTFTRVSPEDGHGHDLPYLSRTAASGYLRFNLARRGIKASLDVRHIGAVRHYQLSASNAPFVPPVGYRESEAYLSADTKYEQRIGRKGWAVEAGVNNITNYVMSDLDRGDKNGNGIDDIYERSFDWGPITGRYGFVAFRFNR